MESLNDLFAGINQWHWFGLAVILAILDVTLGASFFLIWIGVSAAIIGVVVFVFPSLTWEYQFLLFGALALTCLLYWHTHLKHRTNVSDQPNLNRRNEQFVGRTITLTEPIINGRGRIHIDDSFWRIEGPDLPEGTLVKVVGVDGVVLKVAKT